MSLDKTLLTVVRGGEVFAPEHLGRRDILIADGRIAQIAERIELSGVAFETVDASDCCVVPGFVDALVHITGGGGEGGFRTRTPEMNLSDATLAGVTTVVGVLGTDAVTRTLSNLLAKAHALCEDGLSVYCHTGSYQIPAITLTGSVQQDLLFIDKFIGVGEVAIADHRSSQPSLQELRRLAADARVGGMLAGKAGIVNVHVGDGAERLDLLEAVVAGTDLPRRQFYPTHINRTAQLLDAGFDWLARGGVIDFTTSTTPEILAAGEVKCSRALAMAKARGLDLGAITFTSDGHASLPRFDRDGELVGLQVGRLDSLWAEVRDAIVDEGLAFSEALAVITANPARVLKLPQKGRIRVGGDADLVLLSRGTLSVDSVLAGGRRMVREGRAVVRGLFEQG